jgi:hypothetical protein
MMRYVDVRGVWPVIIVGVNAVELTGFPRDISVQEAERILADLQEREILSMFDIGDGDEQNRIQ